MKIMNEEITKIPSEEVGKGQIIVCTMSCGGLCILLASTGIAAAFANVAAALY